MSSTQRFTLPPSGLDSTPSERWCAEGHGFIQTDHARRSPAQHTRHEVRDCSPWPIDAEAGQRYIAPESAERLRSLAAHWLKPFEHSGVREEELMPRLGYNRSHCDRKSPSRICPLVMVQRGEIFVYIPYTSRLFPERLPSCRHLSGDSPGGASMRRLLHILRFMRSTLSKLWWWNRKDFAVRVCVDEFCHGVFEDRPLPWFTMISCLPTPSLPAVQWNTLKGRDPNLSEWDQLLLDQAELWRVANASWHCRIDRAVWRGSASEPFSTNMRWTSNRTLERLPITKGRWKSQGRLALVWQHCIHPMLLDVHMRGLQGANPGVGKNLISDPQYKGCVAKLGVHKQKVLSLAQQARAYQYLIHVEGVGGWADRLKHLLLSHAVVIKQDMGVREWFEPLFHPFVHYVPVSSKLINVSNAVRWLRKHDARAQAIARAASRQATEVFSVAAMSIYMEALILGYARLYRDSQGVAGLLERLPQDQVVKFDCGWKRSADGNRTYDCSFFHRKAGKPIDSVMDAAMLDGSTEATQPRRAGWC